MVATNDIGGIRHTLKTYFRLPLAASVPMTRVLFLFAEPLVSFIFERGASTGTGAPWNLLNWKGVIVELFRQTPRLFGGRISEANLVFSAAKP
jgi:hypothetical protein